MLGERLTKLRSERKLTQQQVADKIHISRATYAQYEINRRVPEYLTLEKLADYFEVTIDHLVGRDIKEETSIEETELNEERKRLANIIVNIKDPEKKKQAIAYLEYLANSPTDGAKK